MPGNVYNKQTTNGIYRRLPAIFNTSKINLSVVRSP